MEIDYRHNNTYLFKIEAVEKNFRANTNNLDYYDVFEDEKTLWFRIKNFLSPHKDLDSLSKQVYRKFGFLHPEEGAMLFTQYNLLKDDLPDGDSFEDFLEDLEHFIMD